MFLRNQKPHFIRTATRQQPKTERSKNKLLCLIVKRICTSKLRNYFHDVHRYGQNNYQILDNAFKRVNRNIQFVKLFSWKKIIFFSASSKRDQHLIKFLNILAHKYQFWVKSVAFKKVQVYGNNKLLSEKKAVEKFKDKMIGYVLQKIKKKRIMQGMTKIRIFWLSESIKMQKYKYLSQQLNVLTDKSKQYAWSRILSVGNSEHNDIQHELGQLNKEMDSMRRELLRKKKQIEELKNQILQKRIESEYNMHSRKGVKRTNSLQNSRKSLKSIGSHSRRDSSQDISEKRSEMGSCQNINNTSILSWLNGSFGSIKSGKSSMSRSITGLQCYCKYREKYNQYKAQTTSLRNQLQIIKSELQVTKDLNEHLQQQISNLCYNNDYCPELELLRKEVKDLRREKEGMKQKMMKNQKYIANLKVEFKTKIQNLYRNLKKNSSSN